MPVIADSSNAGISSPGITLGVSAVTTVSVEVATVTVGVDGVGSCTVNTFSLRIFSPVSKAFVKVRSR